MATLATRLSRPHRCNAYRALRYELILLVHLQAFTLSLSLAQVEALFHTRCDNNPHLLLQYNEMRRQWNHLDLPPPTIIIQTGNKQTGLIQCMIHPLHRLQCVWKCSLPLKHQEEGQSITHQPTQSRVIHLLMWEEARHLLHPRP